MSGISRSTRALAKDLSPIKFEQTGFKLLKQQEVSEISGTAYLFEHIKTGARLLYLSNKDDNKVFSVGFKTITKSNNGIPHILEHSLLCGSRKFPVKEPFVELLKGSLNTFLNAMTFPDKTLYPIASRNDKDFINLMDVYLDAVFFPRIDKDPLILKQEGWHYEIDPKTQDLTYNGVVFNEMKGSYSNPDNILETHILKSLFPDTVYQFDSGGEPGAIPQLTQKEFVEFHQQFYQPSNSYIYLYGNGDIEKHLSFIDKEYLNHFTKKPIKEDIGFQKAFKRSRSKVFQYSVNPTDSLEGKTLMAISYVVGKADDPELAISFNILNQILTLTSASPLKRALLDQKIGKDVFGYFENEIKQPYFTVQVRGTDSKQKELFVKTVQKTLKKLAEEGLDQKLVEASLNRYEFLLREFDTGRIPKGLGYNRKVLSSWLYNGDPLSLLQFEKPLEKIRSQIKNRYFEKLITKHLLNNNHKTVVVLEPKRGLDEKNNKETIAQLKKLKKTLSKEELFSITKDAEELKKKQISKDPPQELAKIPLLTLSDVNPKAEELPLVEGQVLGVPLLKHDVLTNKISYVKLYFDLTVLPEDKIQDAVILSEILTRMSTSKRSFEDLTNEINLNLGGLSFDIEHFVNKDSLNNFKTYLVVSGKMLTEKLPQFYNLVEEILLGTQFDDQKRLQELIQEIVSSFESNIPVGGNSFAAMRTQSYYSKVGRFLELYSGLSFYEYLKNLENSFSKKAPSFIADLKKLQSQLFNKNNLIVSHTESLGPIDQSLPLLEGFIIKLPHEPVSKKTWALNPLQLSNSKPRNKEGLIIPSKVQFVSQGGDYKKQGETYSGSMEVLNLILSSDFLWNEVRVQGGAYGSKFQMNRAGLVSMTSYRDPNLKRTLDTYEKIPEYLANFKVDEREMRKFILGTISNLDAPLTPSMKGSVSDKNYLMGLTQEDIQKTRDEVLKTQPKDIQNLAPIVKSVLKEQYYSVVGGSTKINEDKALFQDIVNIMK